MLILLDTSEFLWFLTDDPQLRRDFKEQFEDSANVLVVSVVTDWEISIKHGLGKLPLPEAPGSYIPRQRQRYGMAFLPLVAGPAYVAGTLPPIHRDPFDRMLVAQARFHDPVLASHDPNVRRYEVNLL